MKKALVCLAIVLPIAVHLRAASIWTDTGAEIDERVSDTQSLAPINLMRPEAANLPFSNFRYPHVDGQVDVTFIADDPAYGGGAHHGVYRSLGKTGELVALMRKGDPVPGTASARFSFFRGLQVDGADFVINVTDTEGRRGLYHYSNGKVTTLARTVTTSLPGVDRPLTIVEYGALSHGRVLYTAMAGSENLLVLHDLKTQQARILVRNGMSIPNQPGLQFHYLSHQNWMDENNIVFRGAASDHNGPMAGSHGIYGWFGINWDKADKALDPGRLIALADDKTTVPLLGKGARFNDFRSAPVRNGLIGFIAGGENNTTTRQDFNADKRIYTETDSVAQFSGVYYRKVSDPPGTVRSVVDTETALKGLFPGNFTDFEIWSTVFDHSLVFVGHAGNGYVGVFLYRVDKDELFLLTDNRQPLEGKEISNFEIAGDFLVQDRFAVTAVFKDRSSGVYLATIPKHAFKRMSANVAGTQ
jgi:hypothetical protein